MNVTLGQRLRAARENQKLSLRDVEQLAKSIEGGSELSGGYLSVLERDQIKKPAPPVLLALSKIYELDYLELMELAGYLPEGLRKGMGQSIPVAFRGASQLNEEARSRIQRLIDLELLDARRGKRRRDG